MIAAARAWSVVAAVAAGCLGSAAADALPRMTLMAGSRCSNCHVNPQGSGTRTEFGFYSMAQNGAVTWDKLGWQSFHDLSDNRLFDGRLTLGMDLRSQMAKFGVPRWDNGVQVNPSRQIFPMQQNLGAAFKIAEWLSVAATGNLAHFFKKYAGQTPFDGWVRVAPDPELPSVRVGMIQPSMGIRHDDHTILLRRNPFQPALPLFAPNWNELGAEVSYEGLHWLSVEAGAFKADNLSKSCAGTVKADDLVFSGRLTLWPQSLDLGVNAWLGGSFLKAGQLTAMGGHLGLGKTYWGSLMGEVLMTKSAQNQEVMSALVHAAYPLYDWLVFEARYEVSKATKGSGAKTDQTDMTAVVAGVQFVPLPNVELRPEYRLLQNEAWTIGQWALQMHVWF
ncbi:MAG: hypothetical protein FJ100_15570 [Deltaproteobacteria bacterium]|nr:hypothetical protein [Deltaproteobacteria bacterium]